jgi:NTE family protein
VKRHHAAQIARTCIRLARARAASAGGELAALGCDSTMHIVRLPYAGRDWNMAAKDINFSAGSIEWRWEQGYQDALRAIKAAGWLAFVTEDTPLVVHELAAYERDAASDACQNLLRVGMGGLRCSAY